MSETSFMSVPSLKLPDLVLADSKGFSLRSDPDVLRDDQGKPFFIKADIKFWTYLETEVCLC